jgi:NitT/TauT family transport system substrate-binding protein
MKKNVRLLCLNLFVMTALLLAACSGSGGTDNSANSGGAANEPGGGTGGQGANGSAAGPPEKQLEKTSLTVAFPTPNAASFTPVYLAESKGFFRNEGLDVTVVGMGGNSDAMQAIAGGSADIVLTSLSGLVDAIKANQPIVAFWGFNNGTEFTIHSKTVSSMAELKGKRIGISSFGGLTDFVTRVGLEMAGLDPEKDVEILVVAGGSPPKVAAMDAGQVDAAILTAPTSFQAVEEGYQVIFRQTEINPTWPTKVAIAHERFVRENPESIKAFLRGLQRAIDLIKNNPQEGVNDLVKRVNYEEKYAILAVEELIPGYPDNGEIDQSGIDTFWEISMRAGDVDEAWPEEKWLNRTFIDSAAEWLRN